MKTSNKGLHTIEIKPEFLSRGSDTPVKIEEAIVFDVMPRILGERFRVVEPLRRSVHFYGQKIGVPFLDLEEAYKTIAQRELKDGNTNAALEAYKRGLYSSTCFVRAMASIQGIALLTSVEIQRLNVLQNFKRLERDLVCAVSLEGIPNDLPAYESFLNEVRQLEKNALRFNQLYFFGAKGSPWEDKSKIKDRKTGEELRDTYVRMFRFSDAAGISKEIGDFEGEQKYLEMAKNEPRDNPRLDKILRRLERD